jgi:nucleoside-diphosphate-sugar epimerase
LLLGWPSHGSETRRDGFGCHTRAGHLVSMHEKAKDAEEASGMKVFVAGATGAVGRRLVPMLIHNGHEVVATTRSPDKVDLVRSLGAQPMVVDGLDSLAVGEAVARAEPDAVIHQMTALAGMGNLRRFDRSFAQTNALRTAGVDNLLAASVASGVQRFIAQSFTGWSNAREGSAVKTENDPLDPHPPAAQRQTLDAIGSLERAVLRAGVDAVALRYGFLYGPGASEAMVELIRKRRMPLVGVGAGIWSFVHVDDAASAAVAALKCDGLSGRSAVYNVVDDEPAPVSVWLPYLAEAVGAKRPPSLPVWLARLAAGEVVVSLMTKIRGSSNAKIKAELDWQPSWKSWRQGFAFGLGNDAVQVSGHGHP